MDPPRQAAGDRGEHGLSFDVIYTDYFDRVYRYMRYRVDDPVAAEDLTATTFERVLTVLPRCHPRPAIKLLYSRKPLRWAAHGGQSGHFRQSGWRSMRWYGLAGWGCWPSPACAQ